MAEEYQPEPVSVVGSLPDAMAYLQRELARISAVFSQRHIVPFLHKPPEKPREGMVVGADGEDWDPGGGEGLYVYYDEEWHLLGYTPPDIAPNLTLILIVVSDDINALTSGKEKATFRMPFHFQLLRIKASLTAASTYGYVAVDVNQFGASIFSTQITLEETEETTETAASPSVMRNDLFGDDDEITIDVDSAGTGARGLKVYFLGVQIPERPPVPVFPPDPILTDLQSYWKMEETLGQAFDSVGSNHLTELRGVVGFLPQGKIGNARRFNKAQDRCFTAPSNASLTVGDNAFTFVAWIKFEVTWTISQTIVEKLNTASSLYEYWLFYEYSAGHFTGTVYPTGAVGSAVSVIATNADPVLINPWYFVAFWHDPVANKIYIQVNDGIVHETTVSGGAFAGNSPFTLGGRYQSGASYGVDGLVDEIGFWRKVLTPSERISLYNSGFGKTYPFDAPDYVPTGLAVGLVAYWPMEEQNSSVVVDVTPKGINHLGGRNAPPSGNASGVVSWCRHFDNGWLERTAGASLSCGDIDFTLSIWVMMYGGYDSPVMDIWGNGSEEYQIYYNGPYSGTGFGGSFTFSVCGITGGIKSVSSNHLISPIPNNTWHHVIAWHDSVKNEIGIVIDNGTPVTLAHTGGVQARPAEWFMLGASTASVRRMAGKLDEAGLWKRMLTAAERAALYNSGAGRTYPFRDPFA